MEKEILRMQIRLFRKACGRWNKTNNECADIFDKYEIDTYIKDFYEILHVQGDEANLNDIEEYLLKKGAVYDFIGK